MPEKIKPLHDVEFDIAYGKFRNQKNWQNKQLTWTAFLNKIQTTHHTAETHAVYLALPKSKQDEIKDIGGFVGGYLNGGRRKAGTVLHRQLITLDIDFSKGNFWDDFEFSYLNAAALYSTHKHSPDSPRLRLIMPLDREVAADEYQAIARKIAGTLDIEIFDPTTFQAERLMYWPSTSKDGTYQFNWQDGPLLCADEVLARYTNWNDSSEWPVSSRVDKILLKNMEKQGDPLEKPGVIGAWCRTFSIDEVIEKILSDVYEPCEVEGRYTYKEGSTAAGLVVYDGKYAFSHHGSDPISGKLCNAFDLARIHKFGLKDEDAKEDTPSNKLPSYIAMVDFATKNDDVRLQWGSEKLAEARADFEGVFEFDPDGTDAADIIDDKKPASIEWMKQLTGDKHGKYHSTINNVVLILENDPMFKGNIAYDEFEHRAIARRNLPWRKITYATRYLTDMDDDNCEHYIESVYGLTCSKLDKAFSVLYERYRFHPVRDYLNSLQWDGKKRLDTLFIDRFGCEDSDYTRAVTRKIMCAAVARVFVPGIKFDYMLTFVGTQGLGKSTIINKLGRQWFSDSITTVQDTKAYEQLQGVWIIEMAELAGMKKADVETTKHFIAKREDRFRVAYGHRVENFPRQCVFFGSTNKTDFLRDTTGNRRFWPLHVLHTVPKENVFSLTDIEVNQIWAEAVVMYGKKEPLFLSPALEAVAKQVQQFHSEADERQGMIEQYLNTLLPANWDSMDSWQRRQWLTDNNSDDETTINVKGTVARDKVSAAEIWCEVIGGSQKELTSHNTKFIHDIMRSMPGWKQFKTRTLFKIYGNQIGYFNANSGKYKHFNGIEATTANMENREN